MRKNTFGTALIHRWHTKTKSKRLVKPTAKKEGWVLLYRCRAERPVKQNPPERQRSQCAGSQWHPIRHAQADRVPLWGRNTDHTERAGIKKSADRAACTSYGKDICAKTTVAKPGARSSPPLWWSGELQSLEDDECTLAKVVNPGRLQQFCGAVICARVKWLWSIHRFITRISTFKHFEY